MRKIQPISFEDLKKIFKGKKFTERLTKSANETLEYWAETQFNVVRNLFGKKLTFGSVVSKSDALDNPHGSAKGGFSAGLENDGVYEKEIFPLIVYHTHTPPENSLEPSEGDLLDMANLRLWTYDSVLRHKYDNRLLYIIGSLADRDNLELLVLQEKIEEPMGLKIAKGIPDCIECHPDFNFNNNNIIARLYDKTPELKATLLTYKRSKNRRFEISEDELEKLKRFFYSITYFEEIIEA